MIAGISVSPAKRDALTLLSPAIISYPFIDFFTIIGWNTPCSLIESDSSFKASSSNTLRGWYGLDLNSSNLTFTISSLGVSFTIFFSTAL